MLTPARRSIVRFWREQGGAPRGLLEFLDELDEVAANRGLDALEHDTSAIGFRELPRVGSLDGDDGRYWSVKHTAKVIGISKEAVRQALAKGHLVGRQLGGPGTAWLVDQESARQYTTRRNKPAA